MDAGGESQQAVMSSLQELLDGKTEGGLRALATQLGMQPDGLATQPRHDRAARAGECGAATGCFMMS